MATNNAVNAPFPLSATQGGLGLASPTAHGILIGEGASAVTPIVLTNGQLLIGSTGLDPVAASLTPGAGISITPGAGTLTISNTGSGVVWTTVASSTQALAVENGYVTNNGASLVTYTLPATAAVGQTIEIAGLSSGGWLIAQNASQLIHLGSAVTTTGVGGSLASTNQFDNLTLTCIVTNTTWQASPVVGNITVV